MAEEVPTPPASAGGSTDDLAKELWDVAKLLIMETDDKSASDSSESVMGDFQSGDSLEDSIEEVDEHMEGKRRRTCGEKGQFARKKLHQNYRLTFNRVTKNDFRRQLPVMFNNVLLSGSEQLIHSFFQTFCSPDCSMTDRVAPHWGTPFPLAFNNPTAIAKQFCDVLAMFPDCVSTLKGIRIVRRFREEGCEILVHTHFKATLCFPFDEMGIDISSSLPTGKQIEAPNTADSTMTTASTNSSDSDNSNSINCTDSTDTEDVSSVALCPASNFSQRFQGITLMPPTPKLKHIDLDVDIINFLSVDVNHRVRKIVSYVPSSIFSGPATSTSPNPSRTPLPSMEPSSAMAV